MTNENSGDTFALKPSATRSSTSRRFISQWEGRDYINSSGQKLIAETVSTANQYLRVYGYTMEQTAAARRRFVERLRETLLRERCLPPDTVQALLSSLRADALSCGSSQPNSPRD